MDAVEKTLPLPGIKHRTAQPPVSSFFQLVHALNTSVNMQHQAHYNTAVTIDPQVH